MSKYDIYLYENSKVLKNLLDIKTEAELDLAESEYANAGMMLLYNSGFSDFRTYVEIYVNQTYSGVQWPLYIKDTENYNYEINNKITALLTGNIYTIPNHLRDAVVDGFTEYIFSRINEENAGD